MLVRSSNLQPYCISFELACPSWLQPSCEDLFKLNALHLLCVDCDLLHLNPLSYETAVFGQILSKLAKLGCKNLFSRYWTNDSP